MMKQSTVYRETQQCLKSCRKLRGNRRSRLCFGGFVRGLNSLFSVVTGLVSCGVRPACFDFLFAEKLMLISAEWIRTPKVFVEAVSVYLMLRREVFITLQKQPTNGETFVLKNSCHTSVLVEQHLFAVSGTLLLDPNIVICFRLKRRFLEWLRVISWHHASQERKKTVALQDS